DWWRTTKDDQRCPDGGTTGAGRIERRSSIPSYEGGHGVIDIYASRKHIRDKTWTVACNGVLTRRGVMQRSPGLPGPAGLPWVGGRQTTAILKGLCRTVRPFWPMTEVTAGQTPSENSRSTEPLQGSRANIVEYPG